MKHSSESNFWLSKAKNFVQWNTFSKKPPHALLLFYLGNREEVICKNDVMVLWLSLLHKFMQLTLHSDSAQVQTLLAACRRFAMVRISDSLEIRLSAFRSTIPQKSNSCDDLSSVLIPSTTRYSKLYQVEPRYME